METPGVRSVRDLKTLVAHNNSKLHPCTFLFAMNQGSIRSVSCEMQNKIHDVHVRGMKRAADGLRRGTSQ